jgi:hypothetical protein
VIRRTASALNSSEKFALLIGHLGFEEESSLFGVSRSIKPIHTVVANLARLGRDQNAGVALLNSVYGQNNMYGSQFEAVERVLGGHPSRFDPVSWQLLRDGAVVAAPS